MMLDEDYARELKARLDLDKDEWDWFDEDDEPETTELQGTRSQEGYSPLMMAIYALDEHVQTLIRVNLGAAGVKKPPDIRRWPTPFSQLDVLQLHDEKNEMDDLARAFGIKKPGQ